MCAWSMPHEKWAIEAHATRDIRKKDFSVSAVVAEDTRRLGPSVLSLPDLLSLSRPLSLSAGLTCGCDKRAWSRQEFAPVHLHDLIAGLTLGRDMGSILVDTSHLELHEYATQKLIYCCRSSRECRANFCTRSSKPMPRKSVTSGLP